MKRKILGARIDSLSLDEVVARIENLVKAGGFHLMVTANPEILMAARQDQEFLEIINKKAALVTADGIGIIWAGKFLGKPFKERVTGNDLIDPLVRLCLAKKWPVMLMGGRSGVAQKALANLKSRYPGLLGLATGYPKKPVQLIKETKFLSNLIKKEKPAVVLVAMDFGQREKFMLQLIKVLETRKFKRGIVFVGIGGALDFLAGGARRAPLFFQKLGLEWLWRLATQPQTRFIRQLKSLPAFGWLVVREAFRKKGGVAEILR